MGGRYGKFLKFRNTVADTGVEAVTAHEVADKGVGSIVGSRDTLTFKVVICVGPHLRYKVVVQYNKEGAVTAVLGDFVKRFLELLDELKSSHNFNPVEIDTRTPNAAAQARQIAGATEERTLFAAPARD